MSDNQLIPISDEQAKLGQEAIKAVAGIGKFFVKTIGNAPTDFFGKEVGDRIAIDRWEVWQRRIYAAQIRLADDGIVPVEPSVQYAGPLLLASEDEDRVEFHELWDALLAASMNPEKRGKLRLSFIDIIKKLDPIDVAVISACAPLGGLLSGEARNHIARTIPASQDEVEASVANFISLGLAIKINNVDVAMGALGREFFKAVLR